MNKKIIVGMIIFISILNACYQPGDTLFTKDQAAKFDSKLIEVQKKTKCTYNPWRRANRKPKNIIVMISDGSGYNHRKAANIYQYGNPDRGVDRWFPVRIGMTTYSAGDSYGSEKAWSDFDYVRSGATDSAAAATTMSTGVKTISGAIGMDSSMNPLKHIVEWAEEAGKMTGVVTSVEWSHATPAGFVAHNESRSNYSEIAKEMVYSSAVDVIMGCGHPFYTNNGDPLSSPITYNYVGGEETWNDLVAGTAGNDADGDGDVDYWTLIQTREEFRKLSRGSTPQRVIGIPLVFQTLQQSRAGDVLADPFVEPFIETVPTLTEMTRGALNVLVDDDDGFFLMVEGGAVDWASHGNQSGRVIEEQIDFDNTVKMVLRWVSRNSNWNETLLIVTGDHETGYLVGPDSGVKENNEPVWNELINNGAHTLPGMEWQSTSHTNSLIPFFARGRYAYNFRRIARKQIDCVRGNYIDNTDIGKIVIDLLK